MGEIIDNRSFEAMAQGEEVSSENNTETVTPAAEEVVTDTSSETKKVVEKSEDASVKTETPTEEDTLKEKTTDEPTKPVKSSEPRSVRRVKRLLQERAQLRDELAKAQAQTSTQAQSSFDPNAQQIQPDMVSQIVEQRLAQERDARLAQEVAEAWDDDISNLMETHDVLNPESDKFDQELSDALVNIVKKSNYDENGNMVGRVFPSEIWAGMQKSFDVAKRVGGQEAVKKINNIQATSAVQDNSPSVTDESKMSEEQIERLSVTDPRKYTELVQQGLI